MSVQGLAGQVVRCYMLLATVVRLACFLVIMVADDKKVMKIT